MNGKCFGYATHRKTENRLLCSDLVQVQWLTEHRGRRTEIAVLEDLSRIGAGLFTGVPIETGTSVALFAATGQLTGRVQSCWFRDNGFMVSVDLDESSRSIPRSEGGILPEHMLDLTRLDFS